MADQKISELTALTGANVADDDAIAIVDTSATETKKIVFSELKNALDTATGFVRITGDTMTGALDVQSTTTTDGLNLDAIAATISDTAVDIFVYDTRKDSDGGAWRKRTQGTSWYNETLNTAKRGSRKEFPAVAVIVAEADTVTIYDGDDPNLPMWMVFDTISNSILRGSANDVNSAVAGEAQLLIGAIDSSGLYQIDFLKDRGTRWSNANTTNTGVFHLTIAERSGVAPISIAQSPQLIVNGNVNDVAMTVLPNAPIDAATGLPVPTIAVATNGGVSVITDSGAVYDSASTLGYQHVAFDAENTIFYMRNASAYNLGMALDSDYTAGDGFGDLIASSSVGGIDFQLLGVRQQVTIAFQDGIVATGGYGTGEKVLGVHEINKSNPADVLSAGITSSYNTGWMNGDIKLATLSDTDATNVTGSELVTNGTFDTDLSGWTLSSNDTPTWASGGYLQFNSTGAYFSTASQSITTVAGKAYTVSFDMVANPASLVFRVGTTNGGTDLLSTSVSTTGTHAFTFVATTTTSYIYFSDGGGTDNQQIDNISVRLAEEDRSVNGNGLQVFGTVTKSAVATGADLVGYSGFSGSNYLQQPYNSDLDFGTGDFCVMGWINTTGTLDRIVQRLDTGKTGGGFTFDVEGSGGIRLILHSGGTNDLVSSTALVNTGTWRHVVGLRSGTAIKIYIDGVEVGSDTSSRDLSNTSAVMRVGVDLDGSKGFVGSLALLRISATAPTPEQISKIYNDEKVLFQDNAQATLYGSSDAVTALAYDDTTELLHVGTSAGRSSFQGLRRVDNTTTAVGAAISASNGLVADE